MGIIRTLLEKLEECRIDSFVLDAEKKVLIILYREDFVKYFPKLNGKPKVMKDERGVLPYGWDHYAFFNYEGWEIRGNIIHHKSK